MCRSSNVAGRGALLVTGLVVFCGHARAETSTSIDVPRSCGSEPAFSSALGRLIGPRATVPPYRVVITEADAGGRHRLRVEQGGSARELQDRDCRALFRSAVVIVATAALESAPKPDAEVPEPAHTALPESTQPQSQPSSGDVVPTPNLELARTQPAGAELARTPTRGRALTTHRTPYTPAATKAEPSLASQPRLDPARGRPPTAPATTASDTADPTVDSRDSTWSVGVGLGAGALVGLVPQAAPMLDLMVTAERSRWGVVLGVNHVFSTTADAELGRSADIDAFGTWLAGSFRAWSWLTLRAGAALTRLEGTGRGSARSLTDAAWSLGPRLELAATALRTGAMHVEVGALGQWAALRPGFEIEGFGPVYRVPEVSGAVIARLCWAFR